MKWSVSTLVEFEGWVKKVSLHTGKILILASIMILVVFLVASCLRGDDTTNLHSSPPDGSPPTIVQPELAYGEPCVAPCWQGIIPGQSTSQDVAQIMEQLRNDGWVTKNILDRAYVAAPSLEDTHGIMVVIDNSVVEKIDGRVTFDYSLESLIEQFGVPEAIHLTGREPGSQCSCSEWELPAAPEIYDEVRYLLYPSKGLVFMVSVPGIAPGCLCPEIRVKWFCYHDPLSMSEGGSDKVTFKRNHPVTKS